MFFFNRHKLTLLLLVDESDGMKNVCFRKDLNNEGMDDWHTRDGSRLKEEQRKYAE